MAGLLDFYGDPAANMALAMGLLSGGNVGQAGLKGISAAQSVLDSNDERKRRNEVMQAQAENLRSEAAKRAADMEQTAMMRRAQMAFIGGGAPVQGGQQSAGGTAPQGQPGQQQVSTGELERIRQAAILGIPGAKEAWDIYKWQSEPQKMEQGATYVDRRTGGERFMPKVGEGIGMQNGVYQDLPGYARANANIQGASTWATEQAKAGNDLVKVPMSDGTEKMMPRSMALQITSGQPQQRQSGQMTPEQQALILADSKKQGFTTPPTISPDSFWAKSQGGSEFGQTQSPMEAGRQKLSQDAGGKINETWLKTSYEPALNEGKAAQSMLENVQSGRQALEAMGKTGWGTEAKATAANVLTSLGIAPANATMFASNAQKFQSVAMDNLWTKLNAAKGPQTEGDADRAKQTWASLANTPQANTYIMDMAQAKAERDIMRAKFFNSGLPVAQQRGNLQELENEWNSRMPSIFDMPSMQKWKQ